MSLANVTVWAVKQGSDQMYYNEITVSPNQPFILSVEVCPSLTAYWSVLICYYKRGSSMVDKAWEKGHTVTAGTCMRADFPLKLQESGWIKISVAYVDDRNIAHEVWAGKFNVNVKKLLSVNFYNSRLLYKGKIYSPYSSVKVEAGDTVDVTSTATSSVPANITFELYDEYNDKVLAERTIHVTEGSNVHLSFTAEEYCHPVLRALYKTDIVGTDGGWVVSVEGTSPKPKPSQPSKKKGEFISITPVEAAAIGLLVGSVIVLSVGGRNG